MSKFNLHKGYAFGLLLSLAQINLSYGFFALLAFFPVLTIRKPPREYLIIAAIFFGQIVWIWLINYLYESKSWFYMLQLSVGSVIIIMMIFITLSTRFLETMLKSLYILFIIDFCFNLSIYIFGADPFGRGAGVRPGDLMLRVGGLFGHPFYSVNITVVALICGVFIKNRTMTLLAIIGLIINGTFRSPLMLVLIALAFGVFKYQLGFRAILLLSLVFISCVFGVTAITAIESGEFISGNYLRMAAWANSFQSILSNPLLGTHTFEKGPFDDMSLDVIIDYGIAESFYLQLAQDFGVLPAILSFSALLMILKKNVVHFYKEKGRSIVPAALAMIVFTDSFYGTFFGSVYTTFVYAALCISWRGEVS